MKDGAGAFNKAASTEYLSLPGDEKQRLKKLSTDMTESGQFSVKDVMKAGARIFKKNS